MNLRKIELDYWTTYYIPENMIEDLVRVAQYIYTSSGQKTKINISETIPLEILIENSHKAEVKRLKEDLEKAKEHAAL